MIGTEDSEKENYSGPDPGPEKGPNLWLVLLIIFIAGVVYSIYDQKSAIVADRGNVTPAQNTDAGLPSVSTSTNPYGGSNVGNNGGSSGTSSTGTGQ